MPKVKCRKYCIAEGCRNNDRNFNRSFFGIPSMLKDSERCRKWLKVLGREDLIEKKTANDQATYVVCSAHFDSSCIKTIQHLEKDAVPTLFLANGQEQTDTSDSSTNTAISSSSKQQTQINSNRNLSFVSRDISDNEDSVPRYSDAFTQTAPVQIIPYEENNEPEIAQPNEDTS